MYFECLLCIKPSAEHFIHSLHHNTILQESKMRLTEVSFQSHNAITWLLSRLKSGLLNSRPIFSMVSCLAISSSTFCLNALTYPPLQCKGFLMRDALFHIALREEDGIKIKINSYMQVQECWKRPGWEGVHVLRTLFPTLRLLASSGPSGQLYLAQTNKWPNIS